MKKTALSGARIGVAFLMAGVVVQAAAQTYVYRQTTPDGRTIYSDAPMAGTQQLRRIEVPAAKKGEMWSAQQDFMTPARPAAPPVRAAMMGTAGAAQPASDRSKALEQALLRVNTAELNLDIATENLVKGREPLPGERTGNAGGGSRLNEAYHARQKSLEAAKAEAQAEVTRALQALNQLR